MVELSVAFVDNGDPSGAGPVVFLQGGPGVGAVQGAARFVGSQVDLVLFDQRGVGGSTPKLACPGVDALWPRERSAGPDRVADAQVLSAYQTCADDLRSAGIDLNDFNTTAVAADVELLRRLLGHEQWSLWGISYGTRVGLTVMRDHPDGVRAAVLDSVVPFEIDFFATLIDHASRSIEALSDACSMDDCEAAHGDFADTFAALVARLEAEPVIIETTRPVSGEPLSYRVGGAELVEIVFSQLYSRQLLRSLPRQVSRADFGGLEEMVRGFVARRDPERLDLAIGLYYATWCREEYPFHDPLIDDAAATRLGEQWGQAVGDAFGSALGTSAIDALCDSFAVEPAPILDDQPIDSDIPTLVFAGALDPITPPAWSRSVADALSDAIYVEFADHGHAMSTRCPGQIQVDFLRDPSAELDLACALTAGGPIFD
ncbi:MAG: alpha/beta fold hydrolase [Actinomycetota bacterium]